MPRWLQDEEKLVAAHRRTHLAKLWQQHKVFGPVCPQHEDTRAPNTPTSSVVLLADYRHPLPGPQGPFPSWAMKKDQKILVNHLWCHVWSRQRASTDTLWRQTVVHLDRSHLEVLDLTLKLGFEVKIECWAIFFSQSMRLLIWNEHEGHLIKNLNQESHSNLIYGGCVLKFPQYSSMVYSLYASVITRFHNDIQMTSSSLL